MTHADFYIQDDAGMRYLGSVEQDGYPHEAEIKPIAAASTSEEYLNAVSNLEEREDFHGAYPWKHPSSKETDYTYVFRESTGSVAIYKDGKPMKDAYPKMEFPTMNDAATTTANA